MRKTMNRLAITMSALAALAAGTVATAQAAEIPTPAPVAKIPDLITIDWLRGDAGILGDPAHEELVQMLEAGHEFGPPSALEGVEGDPEHPSSKFPGSSEVGEGTGIADSLNDGQEPGAIIAGFAGAQGPMTNADHESGSSHRPGWGGGGLPGWASPSGSSTDGTRIGEGSETTGTDVGKKGKSPWKIIYTHEAPCATSAGSCSLHTTFYADGQQEVWRNEVGPEGFTSTETLYDQNGDPYWEWVRAADADGEVLYETVNGEPVDEQPAPEGGTEPKRRSCFSLPTSRDECAHEATTKQKVSQPGHGEGEPAEGFDPSIQERVDVVTQPNPDGHAVAGDSTGGSPAPGNGPSCTVCSELDPIG